MSYSFSNSKYFINPYTFVEGEETKKYEGMTKNGSNTGVFTCRLYPKTPILVPDPFDKKVFRESISTSDSGEERKTKHYSYKFLHIGDEKNIKPIIPGSSIRGPLRNMYETLTDSCYATARPDQYITARPKRAFEPGLLKKTGNNWRLYSARRYKFQIDEYFAKIGKGLDPSISSMTYKAAVGNYGKDVRFNKHIVTTTVKGREITQYFAKDIGSKTAVEDGYYYVGEYISNKKYVINKHNKTGYVGVRERKYVSKTTNKISIKYIAYIQKDGKRYTSKVFKTKNEAAQWYNDKAVELFGENAYLNKIE